jgi:hypothetical protein
MLIIGAVVGVLVVGLVVVASLAGGGGESSSETSQASRPSLIVAGEDVVEPVTGAAATRTGSDVRFEWSHADLGSVSFEVAEVGTDAVVAPAVVSEPSYVLADVPDGVEPCIRIVAVSDGARSEAIRACLEAGG